MFANRGVVTVPNGISFMRLLCAPVFVWLVFRADAYVWAAGLLVAAAISDWGDGKLARALYQESELGADLDAMADGVLVAAVLVTLSLKAIIPWWLIGALALRELMLALAKTALMRDRARSMAVNRPGAIGVLAMICGVPLMLLGALRGGLASVARNAGLGVAVCGLILLYVAAARHVQSFRTSPVSPSAIGGHPADRGPDQNSTEAL